MILVDVNLLVYASAPSMRQYEASREWLDSQLRGSAPVGLPWPNLLSYVRLVSNPRIFDPPVRMIEAWRQVELWLDCQQVWIPQPTEKHRSILNELIDQAGVHANLMSDIHLAALAIEHGLMVCSADSDFAKFPQVKWFNPLISKGSKGRGT